jgi:MFS family permease
VSGFSHYLQLPRLHLDTGKDIRLLYTVRFIVELAARLASFYVPIFLFQLGNDQVLPFLHQLEPLQQGMVLIGMFYIVFRITTVVTMPLVGILFKRTSVSFGLTFSHFLMIVVLLSLAQARTWPYLLLVAAIANGIYASLFWISFHTLLSKNTLKNHLGEDLGLLQVGMQLVNMLGPALGGVIIVTLGYPVLFFLAVALLLVSSIISFFLTPVKMKVAFSFKAVGKLFFTTDFSTQSVAFVGRYINDAVILLWPLYMYFFLGSADRVGYFYSLAFLMAMMLSMVFGFYIDHTKGKQSFWSSGGILSLLWMVRGALFSIWSLAVVDALDKLVSNFHWLFYDALVYRSSKSTEPVIFFMAREIFISMGAVIFWVVFIGLFVWTTQGWWSLFALAAAGTLLSVLVNDTLHRYGESS